jgi:hypothetical protein
LVRNPERNRPSENLGVDRNIIINISQKNRFGGCELDSFGSGEAGMTGSCAHSNEPLRFMKLEGVS